MKRAFILAFIGFIALIGPRAAAGEEVFLESYWLYDIPGSGNVSSVPIWGGGNESSAGPGTANDAPRDLNGICLVESAIGQMTAQILGSPQAEDALTNLAYSAYTNGESYRFTFLSGGVVVTTPAALRTIVFPGGFNTTNGSKYPADTVGNFDTNQLNLIDYALRARLRINPLDAGAASNLVMLQEDRMLPLEWSGTEALAYADKARLLGLMANGTNQETIAVEDARGYFRNACDIMSEFLANPADAALVEGQDPLLSPAITNQLAQLVDDYLRDLGQYAQASLSDFQIRNLAQFYDPSQQPQGGAIPGPTQTLLNDIDSTYAEIQMRLLQASPFQSLPIYTMTAAGQVQSLLQQIGRMHDSIINGRITFIAGASGSASADSSLYYNEFSTSFMPIFNGQLTQNGSLSSFSVALNLAQNFAQYAAQQEKTESDAINNVTQLAYQYTSQEQGLEQQYSGQLLNLCGYYATTNGNPIPDLFFAALPPGQRESFAAQYVTDGSYQLGSHSGTIYQEWQALQSAETNLLLASVNLSNTFATMITKKLIADAIFSNQVRLATIVLSDGQQIAGIQDQEGEVQASTDQAIAKIQATEAEIGGIGGAVNGGIQGAQAGAAAGPWGAVAGAVIGTGLSVMNTYAQVSADLKIGDVQANTARQLADLNGQITKIQASEQAEMQYVNADTTMLNLSADLDSLRLQANSQAVQVQLAAQNVDQEKTKLATLLGQVSYLLQEYVRAADLDAESPQFSIDLLTARNNAMQQANDAFVLAQQWAFLAAQCFNYEDNCSEDVAAKNYIPGVLAARNTQALFPILNGMASSNALLAATCQSSVSPGYVQISLRNQVFQFNPTQNSGTNAVTSYEPTLQGGVVSTNASASLAAWSNLLHLHLTTNAIAGVSSRTLLLDFRISLDPETVNGTISNPNGMPNNPFYSCPNFGGTIYPYLNTGIQCNGVQVNVVTAGLQISASPAAFTVQLAQNGASVIRSLGFGNPSHFLRYFNFGYYAVNPITASWNGFAGSQGSSAFQDRSPANDDWQLSISDDYIGGPNTTLLNNLGSVTDIQLAFGVRSYTDPVAAFNCIHP